jgi:pyridoxine 4-dehydrogenase
MTRTVTAAASGEFGILGERTVHRLGFGTMRLTGPGFWGPPEDVASAKATLRRARDLDINFIDTADTYGPFVAEDLIRETLHPYEGLLIARSSAKPGLQT